MRQRAISQARGRPTLLTSLPMANGDITIDVAADVAQDAATNGNEAAAQVVTTFDGTAPTVDIQNAPSTINLS